MRAGRCCHARVQDLPILVSAGSGDQVHEVARRVAIGGLGKGDVEVGRAAQRVEQRPQGEALIAVGGEAEIDLLTVHGILHLLGYDHAEPEEHAVMFGLQGELLEKWRSAPADA